MVYGGVNTILPETICQGKNTILMFRGIVAIADEDFWRSCGERVWHNGILTLFVLDSRNEISFEALRWRCARAFGREEWDTSYPLPSTYPFSAPSAPRAVLGKPVVAPDGAWILAGCLSLFSIQIIEDQARYEPEAASASNALDTRALRPGVSFFVQRRRETEARQGFRASGLHDGLAA